jgi:hypothetical protein
MLHDAHRAACDLGICHLHLLRKSGYKLSRVHRRRRGDADAATRDRCDVVHPKGDAMVSGRRGTFATVATANPTLTLTALALRTANALLEDLG